MKTKLYFTLKLAKEHKACLSGINKLLSYFDNNLDENKLINLRVLLESNGVQDTLWALRCTTTSSTHVIIEFSKRTAVRAKEYAAASYAAHAAECEKQKQDLLELLGEDTYELL